jgi:hypothetical protein
MVDEAILEQRLATLERAVADLQRRPAGLPASGNWLATKNEVRQGTPR